MNHIKAVLLDISGVLYDGNDLISGALETVTWLRENGFVLRFVTNTATQSQGQIHKKLTNMGFSINESEIFTAPMACASYLKSHNLRPWLLVHPDLQQIFADLETSEPNAVVIGDSRDQFDYQHLNQAFKYCVAGASLIAIAKNRYFKEQGELQLDSGAFVTAIEWAAGVEALVMGKPNRNFFESAVASAGCQKGQCLMVGDDVDSDVNGAIKAGLQGILVKTGKFRSSDQAKMNDGALCIESICELPKHLTC